MRSLSERLRFLKGQAAHLPRALRILARSSGSLLPLWASCLVVAGLLPAGSVFLTREVVDGLAAVASGGPWRPLLLPAAALGGVLLATEAVAALRRWLSQLQAEKVGDELAARIQRQALAVDLENYDRPNFYDRLHRARTHAHQHPSALLESGGSLAQNGLTLVAMALVLLPFGAVWPLVLLLSAAPGIGAALWVRLEDYAWRRRTTEARRRVWYLDHLMTSRESAAELRALELGPAFQGEFGDLRRQLRDEHKRLFGRRALLEVAAGALALAAAAGVLVLMFRRFQAGEASLGELALFAQAFYQGQRMMRSLLENAGDLYGHLFDLGDFFAFLDLPTADGAGAGQSESARQTGEASDFKEAPAIRCRGVSYRYADGAPWALDGLDLELQAGAIHAIVGQNGAGKSTLIQLLLGLRRPQLGRVEVDGVDLSARPPEDMRRRTAVMFQEPVRYQASAFDNIRVGDLAADPDLESVRRAAADAGVDAVIETLEEGYGTRLGAWFRGGRELSSGQWQRVALARACLRRASLWLLDEPTSAVDLWSEQEFFERLRALVHGRTVVLITHRPSAARFADRVHVLEGGRAVESGTPEELLARGGRYASMASSF
ncbi:MAG: ABC transporter ATP-binding protein [Acidobacteriota bacterium]